MALIYGPSCGAAPVTPSIVNACWTFTSSNLTRHGGSTTNNTSSNLTSGDGTSRSGSYSTVLGQWVYGPIAGQTISGTMTPTITGESNFYCAYYTSAYAAWIMKPCGGLRAVLLPKTKDPGCQSWKWKCAGGLQTFTMPAANLSSQTAVAGDYLVFEAGSQTLGSFGCVNLPILGEGGTRIVFSMSQGIQLFNPATLPQIVWLGKPQPKRN